MAEIQRQISEDGAIDGPRKEGIGALVKGKLAAFAMMALSACGVKYDDTNTFSYLGGQNSVGLETREQRLTAADIRVEGRELTTEQIATISLDAINVTGTGYITYTPCYDETGDGFSCVKAIDAEGNVIELDPLRLSFLPIGEPAPVPYITESIATNGEVTFYSGSAGMGSTIMDNGNPEGMSAFEGFDGLGRNQNIIGDSLYTSGFSKIVYALPLETLFRLSRPNEVTELQPENVTAIDYDIMLSLPSRCELFPLGKVDGQLVTLVAHQNIGGNFTGAADVILGETDPVKIRLSSNFESLIRSLGGTPTASIRDITNVNNSDALAVSVLSSDGRPYIFEINIPTLPTAPTFLAVTGTPTETQINLNWTAVEGATSYVVRYRIASESEWQTLNVTSNSAEISALNPETTYEFTVSAVNARGEGVASEPIIAETAEAVSPLPATPTNFSCECTVDTCHFTWEMPVIDPSDRVSSPATSFLIKYRPIGGGEWLENTTLTTAMRLIELPADTQFDIEIYAVNAEGVRSETPLVDTFRTLNEALPDTDVFETDTDTEETTDAGDVSPDSETTDVFEEVTDTNPTDVAEEVEDVSPDSGDTDTEETTDAGDVSPDADVSETTDTTTDTPDSSDTNPDADISETTDTTTDTPDSSDTNPDADVSEATDTTPDAQVDVLDSSNTEIDTTEITETTETPDTSDTPPPNKDPKGCAVATHNDVEGVLGSVLLGLAAVGRRRRKGEES